ncbi:MAG TPA: hypothetical protein PK544_06700, partial [Spirochaetota bacterium]|nr:hypothetical protein [Spirochaetota bacterium]
RTRRLQPLVVVAVSIIQCHVFISPRIKKQTHKYIDIAARRDRMRYCIDHCCLKIESAQKEGQ